MSCCITPSSEPTFPPSAAHSSSLFILVLSPDCATDIHTDSPLKAKASFHIPHSFVLKRAPSSVLQFLRTRDRPPLALTATLGEVLGLPCYIKDAPERSVLVKGCSWPASGRLLCLSQRLKQSFIFLPAISLNFPKYYNQFSPVYFDNFQTCKEMNHTIKPVLRAQIHRFSPISLFFLLCTLTLFSFPPSLPSFLFFFSVDLYLRIHSWG